MSGCAIRVTKSRWHTAGARPYRSQVITWGGGKYELVSPLFGTRNDAKLRTLSDAEHRVWFNLLCCAAEQKGERGSIRDYDADLLAIEVASGDTELLVETLKKLSRLRIIRATGASEITFLKFEERQYDKPSDRPARVKERVQAHREKQKEGVAEVNETPDTPDVTPSNAPKRDVTPSNAHTQRILRTENTQNREESDPPSPPLGGKRAAKLSPVCNDPPTLTDVKAFCTEQGWPELAEAALDFQSARGWMYKSGPVTDWKAAIRTWKRNKDRFEIEDAARGSPARASPAAGESAVGNYAQSEAKRLDAIMEKHRC